MFKNYILTAFFTATLALTACSLKEKMPEYTYVCGKEVVSASFDKADMILNRQGKTHTLKQTVSASGAKYVSVNAPEHVIFWTKGTQATIWVNDVALPACVVTSF